MQEAESTMTLNPRSVNRRGKAIGEWAGVKRRTFFKSILGAVASLALAQRIALETIEIGGFRAVSIYAHKPVFPQFGYAFHPTTQ